MSLIHTFIMRSERLAYLLLVLGITILSVGGWHTATAGIDSFLNPSEKISLEIDGKQVLQPFTEIYEIGEGQNSTKFEYQLLIETEDVFAVNNRIDITAQAKVLGPKIEKNIYFFLDSFNIIYSEINKDTFYDALESAQENSGVVELEFVGFMDDGSRLYKKSAFMKYPIEFDPKFLPAVLTIDAGLATGPLFEDLFTLYPAYTKLQADSSRATLVATEIQERTNQVIIGLTLIIISGIPLALSIEYFIQKKLASENLNPVDFDNSNQKNPRKKQVDRKTALVIFGLLTFAIIIQLANQQINFEPEELNGKVKTLIFSITISLFGLVFAIMAHKDMNRYAVNAFGLLFVGILPIISAIPLMLNPVSNLLIFFPLYLGVIFGWFFGVRRWVIGNGDDNERTDARRLMRMMLGFLIYIALGTFAMYLIALSFPQAVPLSS